MIDRRTILSGAALLAAGPLVGTAAAQTPPPAAAPPTRDQRVSKAAAENRRRLAFDGSHFSGPAYEWLLERGRESLFFLLGEEHGIAENPRLAAQLFTDLAPSGYGKVAVETSPPMAAEIDAALSRGGLSGLERLFADPGAQAAFFGMREEAQWLADARRAAPAGKPFLWGTDYDVAADRRLIAILKAKAKPPAATAALAELERASVATWAKYGETHGPQYIFSFAGDPALVRAVRNAWTKPDAQSRLILDTLEETLEINRSWVAGRGWESNERRSALMRRNFLNYWQAEKKARHAPRVFLKFGASHLVRGRNNTETFDLGTLVPEIAAMEGGKAFNLLVLPGEGAEIAAFNPSSFTYGPRKNEGGYVAGLQPILSQAFPDAFTLFDTHSLRPLLGSSSNPANPDLLRMVHGFDAILVMSGSTPSSNLRQN